MLKTIAIVGLFALSSMSPLALQAQEAEKSDRCTATLAAAQKRIETGRNVDVVLDVADNIPELYSDYPVNRPYRYAFNLDGIAAESVMASGEFTKSIATTVINNCSSVGLVIFAVYRTDWYYAYGLLPNGKIENFSANCIEPGSGKPRWGQQICF